MTYGVIIDGIDTKEEWGLILLDDLVVDTPAPNINMVSVPGVNGAYDFTEVLGSITYSTRNISFTLFRRSGDRTMKEIRDEFVERFNGKRVELVLPDNEDVHFEGRMTVGGIAGYNTGRIPVTMIADPQPYPEVML